MRHPIARRLLALTPAAALLFATTTAAAADTRSLTAPVGSTKGSVLLPYLEQDNLIARAPVHRLVVRVGRDGNGMTSTTFTTEPLAHALVVRNGCRRAMPAGATCPPAVDELAVSLNGEVVLTADAEQHLRRVVLPPDAIQRDGNELVVTARGQEASAARVSIHAARPDSVRSASFLALQNATQMESR